MCWFLLLISIKTVDLEKLFFYKDLLISIKICSCPDLFVLFSHLDFLSGASISRLLPPFHNLIGFLVESQASIFSFIWFGFSPFFASFWSHWFSSKEPGIPLRFSLIFPFSFWQFSFALRFLLTSRSLFNSIQPFEFM